MKLDFNFDGKTLLKKWWQQVKSNFQTVQDEYNTLEDNLSEEINQRVNLGNDLTDKITKETSDRKRRTVRLRAKFQPKYRTERRSDSSLEIKISDEVNSRQEADDELSGRIEYEKMERQSDNEENKSRFFEKADKTELYGREKNITHKITHSLKKSDFIININAGNGNGTVTINSLPVQTKILGTDVHIYKQHRFLPRFRRKKVKKEKSGLICYMTAITVHWDWRLRNSLNRVMLQR